MLETSPTTAIDQPSASADRSWSIWLPLLLILGVALVMAWRDYQHFRGVHQNLWYSATHDRNAHYLFSLKLANYAREGNVYRVARTMNSARVWPPLHGTLVASTLLVGGNDSRLAVLPSLAGWVAMVVLGFLVARRAAGGGGPSRAEWIGNLAGFVAAVFLLASPRHRLYGTDIMLESLGACLSLAVLYVYLITVQSFPSWKTGRWLGLALTILFIHKYNYWLLVVFALCASEVLVDPWNRAKQAWDFLKGLSWANWLKEQARLPGTYLLLILGALVGLIALHGKEPLVVGNLTLGVYPPFNLMQIMYWIFFAQLVVFWIRHGKQWSEEQDVRVQQVVRWHLWPIATYMLLPRHIGFFLWFLSPANSSDKQALNVWKGLEIYGGWIVEQYHVVAWGAVLAFALLAIAVLGSFTLRRGGLAVVALAVLGIVLTATHPNHQSRYVHSWMPAVWVSAGLGFAMLCSVRLPVWRQIGPWLGGVGVVALAGVWTATLVAPPHPLADGPSPHRPNLLGLRDALLPELDTPRVAVLSQIPIRDFVEWVSQEKLGKSNQIQKLGEGFGAKGPANREGFQRWLTSNQCDTLIYVERLRDVRFWEHMPEVELHGELEDLVKQQHIFTLTRQKELPEIGCKMYVFKRPQSVARTSGEQR